MAKQITIISYHRGHEHEYTGTVAELVENVFGYTLECGHSWNPRIPRYPKTARALVNALNKSADECRRYFDSYDLKSE